MDAIADATKRLLVPNRGDVTWNQTSPRERDVKDTSLHTDLRTATEQLGGLRVDTSGLDHHGKSFPEVTDVPETSQENMKRQAMREVATRKFSLTWFHSHTIKSLCQLTNYT